MSKIAELKLKTTKAFVIAFLKYYHGTAELSFFSTGENQGLPNGKIFDNFLKSDMAKDFIPIGFNEQLESNEKEIEQLVKNNNKLKDKVEKYELLLNTIKQKTKKRNLEFVGTINDMVSEALDSQ